MKIESTRHRRWSFSVVAAGAALVLALTGCGSDEEVESSTTTSGGSQSEQLTEAPAETDFFTITMDGEQLDGSGLVFFDGSGLSLRGWFGTESDHLQLDLTASGFGEQTPAGLAPPLNRVIGLDATLSSYALVDDSSNRMSINERGPGLTVWGDFSLQALDASSGEQFTISGIFDVAIGDGEWDCDFSDDPPACGFLS